MTGTIERVKLGAVEWWRLEWNGEEILFSTIEDVIEFLGR